MGITHPDNTKADTKTSNCSPYPPRTLVHNRTPPVIARHSQLSVVLEGDTLGSRNSGVTAGTMVRPLAPHLNLIGTNGVIE